MNTRMYVCMYVNRADLIKQHTHGPCEGLDALGPGTPPVQGQRSRAFAAGGRNIAGSPSLMASPLRIYQCVLLKVNQPAWISQEWYKGPMTKFKEAKEVLCTRQ